MKVRKRPVEIDAIRFTGDNADEVQRFLGDTPFRLISMTSRPDIDATVWDKLHDTWVGVKRGQWLMIGTRGESWPVDEGVFAETYEMVE